MSDRRRSLPLFPSSADAVTPLGASVAWCDHCHTRFLKTNPVQHYCAPLCRKRAGNSRAKARKVVAATSTGEHVGGIVAAARRLHDARHGDDYGETMAACYALNDAIAAAFGGAA